MQYAAAHGSLRFRCYNLSPRSSAATAAVQFLEEQMRVRHLDGRRDAAGLPVLNPLDATFLAITKERGDLDGASKGYD